MKVHSLQRYINNTLLLCLFACVGSSNIHADWKFSSRESRVRFAATESQFILGDAVTGWDGTLEIEGHTTDKISGSTITFDQGRLESDDVHTLLTGVYDPTSDDTIKLEGDGRIRAEPGTVLQTIEVSGTGNAIEGQPIFTSAVTLAAAEPVSDLSLGIQSSLTNNIVLNNGKITLLDNLTLAEGVKFSGDGFVDINNKTLGLPGGSSAIWDGTITFSNALDIELHSKTVLQSTWTFSHTLDVSGNTSHINGNGEILDMSDSGAVIAVADYHTLYISDCYLKGIGDATGTFSMHGPNSVIEMSNVTMNLGDDYIFDHGQIHIKGANCTFVTGGYTITFTWNEADSDSHAQGNPTKIIGSLLVDGVKLFYDTLDQPDASNVKPIIEDGEYLSLDNNGLIVASISGESAGLIIEDAFFQLTGNVSVGPGNILEFQKKDGEIDWDIVFEGNGYEIQFPSGGSGFITLEDHTNVTFQNVVLRDFEPDHVQSGVTASDYYFGDDTVIELAPNQSLSESWVMTGDTTIDGGGSELDLNSIPEGIRVAAGKTLTFRDVSVVGINDTTGPFLYDDAGKLVMDNTHIVLDNAYTFSLGAMDIYGDSRLCGRDQVFTYMTKGIMDIKKHATFLFDRGVTFSYQANFDGGAGAYENSRNRVQFEDPTASRLYLSGCTLHSTHTGIMLEKGILVIDDKVTLKSVASVDEGITSPQPADGEEAEFRSDLIIEILAGASLDVDGRLRYEPLVP